MKAYVFVREFILGSNMTGLVDSSSGTAVGGEDPTLAEDVLPGTNVIYYGPGTTAFSTVAPAATLAKWNSFIATATATATLPASKSTGTAHSNAAVVGQSFLSLHTITFIALLIIARWF